MEHFDILQLVFLVIVYELVNYIFGQKNLIPDRNNSKNSIKNNCEISGLKSLPEVEEYDASINSMNYQRTPTGRPELSVMAATYKYRLRNRQLQTKAKRTLQF